MDGVMLLIIWVLSVSGAFVEVCGAPAVSVSFGGKLKNDTGVVFAYRNGSWVSLGSKIHTVKSSNQAKKDEKVNYTSELEDLFRKVNLTSRKMTPGSVKATGRVSEKPLGELFLEWLSKHEGTVKPVAAIKPTPIPIVGLQIDFDEGPSGRVTGRDSKTPQPKFSLVDVPLLVGQPVKRPQKPYDFVKSRVSKRNQNSPIDRPINYYLEPEIAQVNQKGCNSANDLKTRFYVRKRRGKSDIDDSVKFIIEPLTISPFDLMNADLADLSSNFHDSPSNLTKRDVKFAPEANQITSRYENPSKHLLHNNNKIQDEQHLRRQRSYIDLFTPMPVKSQSVQPGQKMPKFDDALPVESHVKKRHGKLFLNAKDALKAFTPIPAEESYSGQLLVRNEIPSDRKNKLDDLPKYVMKFLSQCKALIEQNYDGDNAKDNYDDEALLSQSDSPNDKNRVMSKVDRSVTHQVATENGDIDEFESISINKKPVKKGNKNEKGTIKLSIDNPAYSGPDGWAQTGRSNIKNNDQPKIERKNLLSTYDGDDLYDEDLDFHVGDRKPDEKINRKIYYTSDTNASMCRPLFEDYAPSTDGYTPYCSEEPEVTTLSSEQWKVLMDMLNERLPCPTPTTCPTKKKKTSICTTACPTQPTCSISGNSKMTSLRHKSDKSADTRATKHGHLKQNKQTTCQTTEATCAPTTIPPTTTACTTTTTCAPTTTTCATTTTTCATTTTTCATSPSEEITSPCDDFDTTESLSEEGTETPAPRNIKQKNKPAIPQRYLIKIETSKPKHYNELSHLQGRSKPNNWFDNIKNLKLLEGLRSNQQMKPCNVFNPKSSLHDPESAERMIAEGVIPLKTGSTLNLYISYVLNKTKAHKGKLSAANNILEDKLPGASAPRKPFYDSKVHSEKR